MDGIDDGLEDKGNILIGVKWVLERRMEAMEIEIKVDPMGEHVKRTDFLLIRYSAYSATTSHNLIII